MIGNAIKIYLLLFFLIISTVWADDDLQEAKNVALKEYKPFIELCLDPQSKKQLRLAEEDEDDLSSVNRY